MTLDDALKAKQLLKLEPYVGWKPCGKLTGKYFYDTLTNKEDDDHMKVQVRKGWFGTEWVPLIHLKEIKEQA